MKRFEIIPREKMDLVDSIKDFIDNNGGYEEFPVIMKCACLADHELYYVNKRLTLQDGNGRKTRHDYFMFLERARKGFLGLTEQCFEMFAFNETEIKTVAKKQEIFDEIEIEYMECDYEDYDEEDDEEYEYKFA